MERAGDARALERLGCGIFGARRHQARHFGLGDGDLLAPEGGKADVGDGVVGGFGHCVSVPVVVRASLTSDRRMAQ